MKKIKIFIMQLLMCMVITATILMGSKRSTSFKGMIYKYVYETNISFGYLNTLYNKYLGDIIPFKLDLSTTPVFNETLVYKNKNIYQDGCVLEVDNNYLVPSLKAGLVVFIGEKQGYGKTIIVEGEDGNEIWYGNIDNNSIDLYDYIEEGVYIGNTVDDKLYLVFMNDGIILDYEDYLN